MFFFRSFLKAISFIISFSAFFVSFEAHAQTDLALMPPLHAPTVTASPYAMNQNPANLVFIDGYQQVFNLASDVNNEQISGYGSLLAFGAENAAIGFGAQHFNTVLPYTVMTLAFAAGSDSFGIGWSRHFVNSQESETLDEFATSSLSFSARASRHIGFSGMIENVGTPWFENEENERYAVERIYQTGFGVRSTEGEIETDFFISSTEQNESVVGASFSLRPISGIRLFSGIRASVEESNLDFIDLTGGIEISALAQTSTIAARSDQDGLQNALIALEFGTPYPAQLISNRRSLWRIDLSGDATELGENSVFNTNQLSHTDLLLSLDRLAEEDEMAGVYLHLDNYHAGPAQLFELRQALSAIQDSGKNVVLYSTNASLTVLYLAGSADLVFGPPSMTFFETGIGITRTYLADFLQNIGIEAQFVRIGDYKSAPEQYLLNAPSEVGQERIERYVEVVWEMYLNGISQEQLSEDITLEDLLSNPPLSAEDLVENGFFNQLIYADEVEDILEEELDAEISLQYGRGEREHVWLPRTRIAVLHIDGLIVSGESSFSPFSNSSQVGDRSISEIADSLRENANIDGVIIRINSPGGSAVASDEIHHALERLAEEKPVVISMGNVAASGGYYVAAIGVPIVAAPTTITGSIGIYAGTFALDELYSFIGVHRFTTGEGARAHYFDMQRWNEEETQTMQTMIADTYQLFLQRVADGRDMTIEEVDAVGQGRIWTGIDALEVGLVDQLGGFKDAYALLCDENELHCDRDVQIEHFGSPNMGLFGSVLAQENDPEIRLLDLFRLVGLDGYFEELELFLNKGTETPFAYVGSFQ